MTTPSITVDARTAIELLGVIGVNTDKAISNAINDALGQARTKASKVVREDVNLKAAFVKSGIKPEFSKPGTLTGILKISGKPVLLRDYGARKLKRGVSVKVKASGRPEKLKSGFITRNNRFLFVAGLRGKIYPDVRLMYGPDLAAIIRQELKTTDLNAQFSEILQRTSAKELQNLTRGIGRYAR